MERTVHVDEIPAVLNPSRAADLEWILRMTPERLRPDVACAFADLSASQWTDLADIDYDVARHWLARRARLPLGAAFRMARVIGVSVELLFEGFV